MDRCGRRGGGYSEGWVRGNWIRLYVVLCFVVGCYGNLQLCQYHVYSDMGGGAQTRWSEINNSP